MVLRPALDPVGLGDNPDVSLSLPVDWFMTHLQSGCTLPMGFFSTFSFLETLWEQFLTASHMPCSQQEAEEGENKLWTL